MDNKNLPNHYLKILLIIMVAGIALIVSACANSVGSTGEEDPGVELALDETYDRVRNGVRLVLSHNPQNNSFDGFVENTTEEIIKFVRVEVHLSNGVELGPTTPSDLAPGERKDIKLFTKNFEFDSWTALPEVGESSSELGPGEGEN